jgi:hypothetical protein
MGEAKLSAALICSIFFKALLCGTDDCGEWASTMTGPTV